MFSSMSSLKASCSAATVMVVMDSPYPPPDYRGRGTAGRAVEGSYGVRPPPPACGWSPSPVNTGEESLRHLLADAVEAAPAGQDVIGADSRRLPAGEKRSDQLHGGLVIGR